MKTILLSGLFFIITLAGIAQSENRLLKDAKKDIEKTDLIFAELINEHDSSIASIYTNDAYLYAANLPPVCGRENIVSFYKNFPKIRAKFTIQHLYGDAKEYVTDESYYEITDLQGNKLDEGKAIVVWKKTDSGWKMYRDMFSSNGKKQK